MRYVSLEWHAGSFALLTGVLLTAAVIVGFSSDVQANYKEKGHSQSIHTADVYITPSFDIPKSAPLRARSDRALNSDGNH